MGNTEWNEICNKYKTGKKISVTVNIVGKNLSYEEDKDEFSIPLGDLIKLYIEHINIPWYKIKPWDWEYTERKMRECINNIKMNGVVE
jgi:hypothetical protein